MGESVRFVGHGRADPMWSHGIGRAARGKPGDRPIIELAFDAGGAVDGGVVVVAGLGSPVAIESITRCAAACEIPNNGPIWRIVRFVRQYVDNP